jgi:hypothetical protein
MSIKKRVPETTNFAVKQSAGRIKTKHKSDRYQNDGLRIVENHYEKKVKYGINSLVDEALDEEVEELEASLAEFDDIYYDIFGDEVEDDFDNYNHDFDYTYGYNPDEYDEQW